MFLFSVGLVRGQSLLQRSMEEYESEAKHFVYSVSAYISMHYKVPSWLSARKYLKKAKDSRPLFLNNRPVFLFFFTLFFENFRGANVVLGRAPPCPPPPCSRKLAVGFTHHEVWKTSNKRHNQCDAYYKFLANYSTYSSSRAVLTGRFTVTYWPVKYSNAKCVSGCLFHRRILCFKTKLVGVPALYLFTQLVRG